MRAYFITQSSGEASAWLLGVGELILSVDLTLALTQSSGEAGTSAPPVAAVNPCLAAGSRVPLALPCLRLRSSGQPQDCSCYAPPSWDVEREGRTPSLSDDYDLRVRGYPLWDMLQQNNIVCVFVAGVVVDSTRTVASSLCCIQTFGFIVGFLVERLVVLSALKELYLRSRVAGLNQIMYFVLCLLARSRACGAHVAEPVGSLNRPHRATTSSMPATAVCIAGEARSLLYPAVTLNARNALLEGLGADAFLVLSRSAGVGHAMDLASRFPDRWRALNRLDIAASSLRARAMLLTDPLLEWIPPLRSYRNVSAAAAAIASELDAGRSCDRDVFNKIYPHVHHVNWQMERCLIQHKVSVKLRMCLHLVEREEASRTASYRWVVKTRPDVWWGCRPWLGTTEHFPEHFPEGLPPVSVRQGVAGWAAYNHDFHAIWARGLATIAMHELDIGPSIAACHNLGFQHGEDCSQCVLQRQTQGNVMILDSTWEFVVVRHCNETEGEASRGAFCRVGSRGMNLTDRWLDPRANLPLCAPISKTRQVLVPTHFWGEQCNQTDWPTFCDTSCGLLGQHQQQLWQQAPTTPHQHHPQQ